MTVFKCGAGNVSIQDSQASNTSGLDSVPRRAWDFHMAGYLRPPKQSGMTTGTGWTVQMQGPLPADPSVSHGLGCTGRMGCVADRLN